MKKLNDFIKRDIGIVLCIAFYTAFMLITKMIIPHFDGASWYIVNSVQRLLFGIIELFVFIKIFKKESCKEVIHFKNFKTGLKASYVMFLIILLEIVTYFIIGAKSWIDTTVPIVVSCLFLQQITTGFWEELNFRAFVLEGYHKLEHKTKKSRLIYAFVSFAIFGLVHAVECDSLSMAVYRFFTTGIWGFAFSSVYLYTNNVLVVMFMHFITNIFSNATMFVAEWNVSTAFIILNDYGYFVLLGVMLLTAVCYLCKEPKEVALFTEFDIINQDDTLPQERRKDKTNIPTQ